MPRPAAGRCESCGADILWITLLQLEGGQLHPVDAERVLGPIGAPVPGQIAVRRLELVGLVGNVLTAVRLARRLEEYLAKGAHWHTSHFATCPNAEKHRHPGQLELV